jgi:hypothetical protein
MNVRDLPFSLSDTAAPESAGGARSESPFRIEWAAVRATRQSADHLLQSRYAWRGYRSVSLPRDQTADRMTLTATDGRESIGTITVGMDGATGLAAAETFPEEIAALRAEGLRLCEFSKLAAEPSAGGKRLLATLFHVAYLVAHRIRAADTLVMEVNPRHVGFYCRMLGARPIGAPRLNRSVNAPAVLLRIDFADIAAQIATFGGRPELAPTCRTLYPLALSREQEARMVATLMDAQTPGSMAIN